MWKLYDITVGALNGEISVQIMLSDDEYDLIHHIADILFAASKWNDPGLSIQEIKL